MKPYPKMSEFSTALAWYIACEKWESEKRRLEQEA